MTRRWWPLRSAALVLLVVVAVAGCRSANQDEAATEAIRARAEAAFKDKRFVECAELFRQIALSDKDPQLDRYSAARCLARANQGEQALTELEQVARGGYRYIRHIERDEELVSLRGDPRWRPILDRVRATNDRYLAALNTELRSLFDQDQADRRQGINQSGHSALSRRDQQRKARVLQILADGGARLADDYYHAAMVLQHGDRVEDYQLAHDTAMKALETEPLHPLARWLAAASKDRVLMALGKPQLYGTQFQTGADGKVERWPVDPTITNAERARWHVDPIPESK
jgi:hypothetical protein